MKLRSEIEWWLPCGLSMVYKGSPRTRWQWILATWSGYVAMWRLLFRVAWLSSDRKRGIDTLRSLKITRKEESEASHVQATH
jgi:hypothetical protein